MVVLSLVVMAVRCGGENSGSGEGRYVKGPAMLTDDDMVWYNYRGNSFGHMNRQDRSAYLRYLVMTLISAN